MSFDEEEDWAEEEMQEEDECYYGFEVCIDPFCRDVEGCVGCDLQKLDAEEKPRETTSQ